MNASDFSKASGSDDITGVMLHLLASSISPVLTRLLNLSIRIGTVPTAWKTSAVIPVPKSNDNSHVFPSNYRPIPVSSLL